MLVLHYTGMASCAGALDRLCDPAAEVSAHYLIDEDGTTYALVPEDRRAWHAGVAFWDGETDINSRSIGIELVNPGHDNGYQPFPQAQIQALEAVATDIVARHHIPPWRVLGHSDVAPTRKQDPGELFDWTRLARQGLGLMPPASVAPVDADSLLLLAAYGYDMTVPAAALTAFQRHYQPRRLGQPADAMTVALAQWLVDRKNDGF